MRIDHATPRRKIQKLQAHGQHQPGHNQAWPRGPLALQFPKSVDAERAPEHVLQDADDDVGRHVVCIVEPPKGQVGDVGEVGEDTQCRPHPYHARLLRPVVFVEAEDADRRVIQAVQHARARGKVVESFGEVEIAGVEDHAEGPAGQPEIRKRNVVFPQGVLAGDLVSELM